MRSVVIFALVLLAIIATIDAQCKGKYKGKVYKLKKVPRSCCQKNGRLSVSKSGKPSRWGRSLVVRQATKCDAVCPILKALKGCDFMCHWNICQDKCQQECPSVPTTAPPSVGSTDSTDTTETGSGNFE